MTTTTEIKGMSEQTEKRVAISQDDMILAIGALEVVIEKGVEEGVPMDRAKLALSRLKAVFGITV
jgi:hypothetical protein